MNKSEKKTVVITSEATSKSGTSQKTGKPWTVYSFKATDEGNQEWQYKTLSKQIGEKVMPDLQVEIEYEVSQREYEGNTYFDRTVSQMWIDGKPVRTDEKKQWTSRQDDSPEKRQSIERQSFMDHLPALASCKEIPPDIKEAIYAWGRQLFQPIKTATESSTVASKQAEASKPHEIAKPAQGESIKMQDWNDFSAGFKTMELKWPDVYSLLEVKNIDGLKEKFGTPAAAYATLLTVNSQRKSKEAVK